MRQFSIWDVLGPWKSKSGGLIVVLIGWMLASCAGPSNEEIASFAQSGITFSNQTPRVYDYAFQEAVQRENADLLRTRKRNIDNGLTGADSVKALGVRYDDGLKQLKVRLSYFQEMKEHASTLGAYFVALNALASGATSEAAGTAADGLANSLAGLAPSLESISIGGANVKGLIGPLVKLAVAEYANARLQEHLSLHAGTVQNAIALQRSMFQLLANIEIDRAKAPADASVRQSLLKLDKDLPPDWAQRREQSFTFQLQRNPISAAVIAASELERNFNQLVEGGAGALARLERSIVVVETITAIYESNRQGTNP